MPKTRQELVDRVLGRLFKKQAGQTPSEEDRQAVDDELDAIVADLAERDVVYVGDLKSIDDAVFPHLSRIVAYDLAEDFGVTGEDLVLLETRSARAERALRFLSRKRASDAPVRAEYF